METITIKVGPKTFVLDKTKAEEAFANKRVINGRETMFFNILPLKYQWAYDLYKTMKNNHWEPEDIPMQKDCEQWRDQTGQISEIDRWIVKMAIGYFSAAEGIVGDNIIHVVREVVTAPELKLVLGRHAHEENIHADSLVYMISSLGINPHECEAMFEDIPTIAKKAAFVVNNSRALRRKLDLTKFDMRKTVAPAAKVARDAAYVAVGLGVIATQRATARRYDIEQRVKEVAPRVRDEAKATAERVMREANDAVTKVRGEATQRVRNIVDRRKTTTTNVA